WMEGGAGADFLQYTGSRSGAHLDGGDGPDNLVGGVGDDVLIGGADGDDITSNGGNDTIDAGDGNDVGKIPMATTTSLPRIGMGGGTDYLLIAATPSSDVVHVWKPAGVDVQVDKLSTVGGTAIGIVRATGVEQVQLDMGAGADNVTVDTLLGSTVT